MNTKNMFVVDVESNGPCPGLYSMVQFAAVKITDDLANAFHGKLKPLNNNYLPEAVAKSGCTWEESLLFPEPAEVIINFDDWLYKASESKPIFWSDNPAFDWQFINYYFHSYLGRNPFGFSARRIGDYYSGLVKDLRKSSEWKNFE